jgi:hypothetical protein
MGPAPIRKLAWILVLAPGVWARADSAEPRTDVGRENTSAPEAAQATSGVAEPDKPPSETAASPAEKALLDRVWATLSQEPDPDGPINTDRPTFTPANTVVPRGRLQFESGFTVNVERTVNTRNDLYDLPELAMRYGLSSRLEFRTFWLGPTWNETLARPPGLRRQAGGASDMEVGFKWQLFAGDKERKWIPTTALISSIYAPTGGSSPLSSQTVEPYINLIYGWSPTEKLTLAGSTGYLGFRQHPPAGVPGRADNFQRYHQSLVAFYSVTDRTTLFYEWYVLMFTHAVDNRPTHFMDGGVLYRVTANIQLDIRAGFGLSGRPGDFFAGAGLSVRF